MHRVSNISCCFIEPFLDWCISLGRRFPAVCNFAEGPHLAEAVSEYLAEVVTDMLDELAPVLEDFAADPKRAALKLPLIRLKVRA